jgi:hypothetical protein
MTAIIIFIIPGWLIAYGKSGGHEKMLEKGQKNVKGNYGVA